MIEIGIVGLPNVGKSTIFNALCSGQAKVSNYAFCTVDPNRATVPVPDARLGRVAQLFGQERAVQVTVTFVDIAGLVRGASQGEGLGNQFLAHIREVDAVLHVVRCFHDPEVAHVEAGVDAARDARIVDTELALADLGTVQRRVEKARLEAKGVRAAEVRDQMDFLQDLAAALNAGTPAAVIAASATEGNRSIMAELHLLTALPELYLANVNEEPAGSRPCIDALRGYASGRGARALELCGKVQAELAELAPDERAQFAREMGVEADALESVIAASYGVLDLITFYTAVGKEARAWALRKGTTAAEAAGRIHSDMERGFVRAEVADFASLDQAGSWESLHRQGLVRIEGRNYVVQDGDVIHVRFTAA